MPSSKERNCDKIKRLEKELWEARVEASRQIEKRRAADKEIIRMHKIVNETTSKASEGVAQLSMAVDAFSAAVAMKYGAQVGEDAWELHVGQYNAPDLLMEFSVSAEKAADGGRVIRVERRVKDA